MRLRNALALTAALALCSFVAGQQRGSLKVGDPAPGLDVEGWIGDTAITLKPGNVYILLFFESVSTQGHTDGRTMRAFTRLRELYMSEWGRDLKVLIVAPENAEELSKSIASSSQANIGFNIASDRRNATFRAWVDGVGASQFPVAFIVDRKLKIAHFGDPREEEFGKVLGKVLAGRYDPELKKLADPNLKAARRARKVKNWRLADQYYEKIIDLDGSIFADVAIEKFQMMLYEADMADPETAYAYAEKSLLKGIFSKDAVALRDLAMSIVSDRDIHADHRNLEFAKRLAEAAVRLSSGKDPKSLATLATVQFGLGRTGDAVRLQTQAYFLATPSSKPGFKRVLRSYQEAARR